MNKLNNEAPEVTETIETIQTKLHYGFRSPDTVNLLVSQIKKKAARLESPGQKVQIMEVCGGHTHSILKYGLNEALKDTVKFLHGPGCPVCVIPRGVIDSAMKIASKQEVIFTTLGDMIRVPGSPASDGSPRNLQRLRSEGCDIRFLYSPNDILQICRDNPEKTIVYFSIGFETTTPMSAHLVLEAVKQNIKNLYLYVNHVLVPPALRAILADPGHNISAFIGPSHVSVITGTKIYNPIVEAFRTPLVVAGFEPVDILEAVSMIFDQILDNRYMAENQYIRAADFEGNLKAQEMTSEVFEPAPFYNWRGLGEIPESSLQLKKKYSEFDVRVRFPDEVEPESSSQDKGCICPEILKGKKDPPSCRLFKNGCSPENPMGACMVSSEGACAAYYKYA